MKKILDFWQKDIINKFIVLVLLVLVVGFLAFIYFLLTLPKESVLYSAFFSADNNLPTLAVQAGTATSKPTPTTEFFPSMTPLPTFTSKAPLFSSPTSITFATFTPSPTPTLPAAMNTLGAATFALGTVSASCVPNNPPEMGHVVGVIDGNTIKVLLDSDGKIHVIRYIGIAVPKYGETQEPYGEAAEIKNSNLVFAKNISMISDASDMDGAGRLLRYVMVGNTFVNLALVQQGYATAASVAPNTACDQTFQAAEQLARQSQVGRWVAAQTPSAP